ncbi:Uncharacterized conserved protein [Kaistia soli DSM 19436]|uniref:Uncharacterized conserved protein n=1 Tax=Kaistia soli DSM 19436 TaxID=1122133 RepID=A0A1M5CNF6_9HYPH|nr:GFA family protein [Kaistia soli]SHF56147.1 Uncharacterized conserved protein [Kaistia soli DSM 19436]
MSRKRTGGCLCGAVRFELDGEPFLIGVCHCADCRKESGSAFTFYAKWPRAAFRVTGETRTYAGRDFCPACGARLFNLHAEDVELRVGSLDEAPTTIGSPSQEGWIKRRETWLAPIGGASQSTEDTPR